MVVDQVTIHGMKCQCFSQELHIKAIETLAEFSSRVIEQFHKACELMLLPQDKEHSKSPLQRATSLSKSVPPGVCCAIARIPAAV